MNKQALLEKELDLLEQEHEIVRQKKLILQSLRNSSTTQPLAKEEHKSEQTILVEEDSNFPRVNKKQLIPILIDYFNETPTISSELLEKKLMEEHNLRWKSFRELMYKTIKGNHIPLKRFKKDNKVFYAIEK